MNQTTQIAQLDTVISNLKNQLDILIKTRNELTGESKTIDTIATKYECETCGVSFNTKEKYEKHLLTKKHLKATGQSGIKCRACNNTFFGKDLAKHAQDGRCSKSRTCGGCNTIFSNMISKSRHECCERFGKKNSKSNRCLPITIDTPIEPTKEIITSVIIKETPIEPPKEIIKPKPVLAKQPVSNAVGFALPDKEYELKPLPEYTEVVDEAWFLDLHRPMGESHHCWEGVTERATRFFGDKEQMEEFPMYSKGNQIFYVEEDELAFEIEDKGYYYTLIEKYVDEDAEQTKTEYESKFENVIKLNEEVEEVEEDKFLNPLIETEADFDVQSYVKLHKVEPDCQKFRDNCLDIEDCQYQDGHYMYYSNGYLMRNDEPLFQIFKCFGGTMYDIIAIEQNESDNYDTDCSVNSNEIHEI